MEKEKCVSLVSLQEAIKLKNEGFPQGKTKYKWAIIKDPAKYELIEQSVYIKTINVDYYDAPTLSELKTYTDMKNNTGIKEAIDTLINALKFDDGYFLSWQANIAMAIYDEYNRANKNNKEIDFHKICNDGAKNFLEMLMNR